MQHGTEIGERADNGNYHVWMSGSSFEDPLFGEARYWVTTLSIAAFSLFIRSGYLASVAFAM